MNKSDWDAMNSREVAEKVYLEEKLWGFQFIYGVVEGTKRFQKWVEDQMDCAIRRSIIAEDVVGNHHWGKGGSQKE